MKPKVGSEKVNEIDKLLATLTMKKKRIHKMKKERGFITTNFTLSKRIIGEHY